LSVLNRPMFMKKGGEAFPDLSGDGKVTRKDVLMGRGVIPQNKNRGGLMRHDERTIRNVDDELYRIAPKTHDRGRERIDAREEYGRDLREKDYLRAQMNRLANGGQPMPMMPPPMPMGPPPEAQVQMTEDAAAQQGEMLGAEYVDQMMTGIDSADSTEELIDAIRGNDKTLQDRYDELANFVGERDASATPESVLTLVQPTIMMTEQGAMDSGIGELMQGITGEVEMETEMGAPTPMGQGVGELMMAESVEEIIPEMNQGGPVPVQHFQDGMEVVSPPTARDLINYYNMLQSNQLMADAANPALTARQQNLTDRMKGYETLYADALGFGPQDEKLAQLQIYTDIANRGLALAGGVNPNTGQPMTGNTLAQISQAAQGLPQTFVQAGAQKRAAERSLRQAALGQAISDQTAMEQAQFAESLRRSGLAPAMYDVIDTDGTKLTLDFNDPTDEATFRGLSKEGKVASVNRVAAVTQPRARVLKNLVVEGEVVGPVDVTDGLPNDTTVQAMLLERGLEGKPYTFANLETVGLGEQTALEEGLDTLDLGTIEDSRNKAQTARRANRQLDVLEELVDEGQFITGAFSDTRQFLGQINALLNNPLDFELIGGPEDATAIEGISGALGLELLSRMGSMRATNLPITIMQRVVPQLSATPEGNLQLIEINRALNNYDLATAKIIEEHVDAGGLRQRIQGKTVDERLSDYEKENPIISQELLSQIQGTADSANLTEALNDAENTWNEKINPATNQAFASLEEYISSLPTWEQTKLRVARSMRQRVFKDRQAILDASEPR